MFKGIILYYLKLFSLITYLSPKSSMIRVLSACTIFVVHETPAIIVSVVSQ